MPLDNLALIVKVSVDSALLYFIVNDIYCIEFLPVVLVTVPEKLNDHILLLIELPSLPKTEGDAVLM